MRVLLHVGKGGAGTTTVAAATAVAASRAGVKTLLLSTGWTSSLTDVLGLTPDVASAAADRGPELELEPGLSVLFRSPDPLASSSTPASPLTDVLGALGAHAQTADDLLSWSGVGDVLALSSLRREVAAGPWDLVVVDVTGGAQALRLLTAPEILLRIVGRLRAPGGWPGQRPSGPDARMLRSVSLLHSELAGIRDVLRAPTTSVRLVLTPGAVPVAQARRTFTGLAVQGYQVDGIVLNAVRRAEESPSVPPSEQVRLLEEVDRLFAPVRVQRLPWMPVEPVGAQALQRLGATLLQRDASGSDPVEEMMTTPVAAPGPRVRRVESGYELVLPAPLAVADQIDLSRQEDDLELCLDGHRRTVPLPSVLRRCVATGAQLGPEGLVVAFVPDPTLWPTASATGSDDGEAER